MTDYPLKLTTYPSGEKAGGRRASRSEFDPPGRLTEDQTKQVEIVRKVHDQLLQHMEQAAKLLRETDMSIAEMESNPRKELLLRCSKQKIG